MLPFHLSAHEEEAKARSSRRRSFETPAELKHANIAFMYVAKIPHYAIFIQGTCGADYCD